MPAGRVALVWRAAGPLVAAGRPAPVSVARNRRRPPLPRHPPRDATSGPAAPGAAARPRATGRVGGYGPGRVRSSTALSGWQAGNPPASPRAPGRTGSATGHRLRPGCSRPGRNADRRRCPRAACAPDCWGSGRARLPDGWGSAAPACRLLGFRPGGGGFLPRPLAGPPPSPHPAWYPLASPSPSGPGAGTSAPPVPPVPHHRGGVALRFRGPSAWQLIVVRRPGRG